jgi:hypothetical protein
MHMGNQVTFIGIRKKGEMNIWVQLRITKVAG